MIDVMCEDDFNTFKEQNKAAEGIAQLHINSEGYPVIIDWAQEKADKSRRLLEKKVNKK